MNLATKGHSPASHWLTIMVVGSLISACGGGGSGGGSDANRATSGASKTSPEVFSVYHDKLPGTGKDYVVEIAGVGLESTSSIAVNGEPATQLITADSQLRFIAPGSAAGEGATDITINVGGQTLYSQITYDTPIDQVSKVAVARNHSCLLRDSKQIYCWGRNQSGSAAANYNPDVVYVPTRIDKYNAATPALSVIDIAVGDYHSCVALENGTVECWGQDSRGQMGNSSTTGSATPLPVDGLNTAIKVSAGERHTCALLSGGALTCWGEWGSSTDIGDGDTPAATPINGSTKVGTAITSGAAHVCALLDSGAVECGGNNQYFQLSDGSLDGSAAATTATAIAAAANHTCALLETGEVACWGYNGSGNLGNSSFVGSSSAAPQKVDGIDGLSPGTTAISISGNCAALENGALKCWGENSYGIVGDGTRENRTAPVAVNGLDGVSRSAEQVVNNQYRTCTTLDSGSVMCWGDSLYGKLGLGNWDSQTSPRPVSTLNGTEGQVQAMDMGQDGGCAIDTSGAVSCWGTNNNGVLGSGQNQTALEFSDSPVATSGIDGVTATAIQLSRGYSSACAVLDNGAVQCWGYNDYGMLGQDPVISKNATPTTVSGLDGSEIAEAVSIGYSHACALMEGGAVKCWGENYDGQLGIDSNATTESYQPVDVNGIDGITASATKVEVGEYNSCALLSTGAVKCWGSNSDGRLGIGDNATSQVDIPTVVAGIDGSSNANRAKDLSLEWNHACAVMVNGTVRCWGSGGSGQLGNGQTENAYTPVEVQNLTSATHVSVGSDFSCAQLSNKSVKCWGDNGDGTLGRGNLNDELSPVSVLGLNGSNAAVGALSVGERNACALLTNGALMCWGRAYQGAMGNDYLSSLAPSLELMASLPPGVIVIGF